MYFKYYINYVDIVGYGYCLTTSRFFNFNQSVPLVITGVMIDAIFTWNHVILTHNDSSLARAVVWAPATLFCFFQSALTSSALVTLEPLLVPRQPRHVTDIYIYCSLAEKALHPLGCPLSFLQVSTQVSLP